MTAPVHPEESLIKGEKPFPIIPACEHIVGKEKFIAKALQMQDELGRYSTSHAIAKTAPRLDKKKSMPK